MKKQINILFFLVLLIGSCTAPSGKVKTGDLIEKVENNLLQTVIIKGDTIPHFNILERMKYHNVPGLSMAVIYDGKIQWAKGYGYTSFDSIDKVDTNTMFQAASISKPVAAMMALQLVEQGKLDLDKDVNTYLKDWKVETNSFTKQNPVTLRGLLTHTAGLTVHGFMGYALGEPIPDILQILDGEDPANSDPIRPDTIPGSISRYSGGGYTIMQKLLEDITGEDFPSLMKVHILDKLEMSNSTYEQPLPVSFEKQATIGHRGDGSQIPGKWHIYPEMAAAGLWTTPSDLAKYVIEVQQSYQGKSAKVLSHAMTVQMLTKHMGSQGLGPGIIEENDTLVFGHGGANEGFRCQFFGFVRENQGVVIMTNSDNGSGLIWEVIRSISDVYQWSLFKPKVRTSIQMDAAALMKYKGSYDMNPEYILQISLTGDELFVHQNWDKQEYRIIPESDTIFYTLDDNVDFVFEIKEDGTITGFTAGGQYKFKKNQ
jgi:CubicO group peptidase (beta-lactamase class C family)